MVKEAKMKQTYTVTLEVTTTNIPSGDLTQSEMNSTVKRAIKKDLLKQFIPAEWQPRVIQVRKKATRGIN